MRSISLGCLAVVGFLGCKDGCWKSGNEGGGHNGSSGVKTHHLCSYPGGSGVHMDGPCIPPNCPQNSPVANEFPIDGIDGNGSGACDPEGVQLVPGSLHGGNCGDSADLVVDETHLIGKIGERTVCQDEGLVGAHFSVESWRGDSFEFKISRIKKDLGFQGFSEKREGYEIDDDYGRPVCTNTIAVSVRIALELSTRPDEAP